MKNDIARNRVIAILWFVLVIIAIILMKWGSSEQNSAILFTGLLLAFLVVIFFIGASVWLFSEIKRDEEAKKELLAQLEIELKEYASLSRKYNSKEQGSYETLSIKKRSSKFFKAFSTKIITHTPMSYNPEKYIYTSATVGGITTGGIDKVGGNYVKTGKERDTGKRELLYFGHKVERIQLTDELYKEAQASTIKKYLNDEKQIVVEEKAGIGLVLSAQLYGIHSSTTASYLYEGYPTAEKCREIITWICGI